MKLFFITIWSGMMVLGYWRMVAGNAPGWAHGLAVVIIGSVFLAWSMGLDRD